MKDRQRQCAIRTFAEMQRQQNCGFWIPDLATIVNEEIQKRTSDLKRFRSCHHCHPMIYNWSGSDFDSKYVQFLLFFDFFISANHNWKPTPTTIRWNAEVPNPTPRCVASRTRPGASSAYSAKVAAMAARRCSVLCTSYQFTGSDEAVRYWCIQYVHSIYYF